MMLDYNKTKRAKNLNGKAGVKRAIAFIVLHDTAGSGTPSDVDYLVNDPEHRKVSVDFVVTKDGTVWQINPDPSCYWTNHAGRSTRFRTSSSGIYTGQQCNEHSIGIEISQKANMKGLDPAYPAVQVNAVAQLCRDLCTQFHIAQADITTHAKLVTDGSRSDPREFPWLPFWDSFAGNDSTDPKPVVATPLVDSSKWHMVIKGDTLWGLANMYQTTIENIKSMNHMNTVSNVINVGQRLMVKE